MRPRLTPAQQIKNPEVRELASEARSFLESHEWCLEVTSVDLAWAVAGVLGVFEVRIRPAHPDVDSVLWVVVGDLPSAYLVQDDAPTWKEALAGYIFEMRQWVDAVRDGGSLDDVFPVDADPTPEPAEMLAERLALIEAEVLTSDGKIESDA